MSCQLKKLLISLIITLVLVSCGGNIDTTEVPTVAPTVTVPLIKQVNTPPSVTSTPEPAPTADIYEQIRQEAIAPNDDMYHPLPLVSSWNAGNLYGNYSEGFYMSWQLDQMALGHHFLWWAEIPVPGESHAAYWQDSIQKAAQLNLPISFIGRQWEESLYQDSQFTGLPYAQNPLVFTNGKATDKLSPFGGVDAWYQAGYAWGASTDMQTLIQLYPAPPLVIFVSNNEAPWINYLDVASDQHYQDYLRSIGKVWLPTNELQKAIADGWILRYKKLKQGFLDGLINPHWQKAARFIIYAPINEPGFIGRSWGWMKYSLYSPGLLDPAVYYSDGVSSEAYVWCDVDDLDNNTRGILFQGMNYVWMKDEALRINKDFWYEVSTWDEDLAGRSCFSTLGQEWTPKRYSGFVQFLMWEIRPRLVREYRDYKQTRVETLPYMMSVINAVDRVYTNSTLTAFWRQSDLVSNGKHPYQIEFPSEFEAVHNNFLLTSNAPRPGNDNYSVMALARVRGTAPMRQWLVYAYAPLGSVSAVQVTIPEYKDITVDVSLQGSFYLVDEATGGITVVDNR